MPHFRKKPVVIEAHQWDGSYEQVKQLEEAFGVSTISKGYVTTNKESVMWIIGTLEGPHQVTPGDYIIRGVKGEFYPCKPDIFEMTYEPA